MDNNELFERKWSEYTPKEEREAWQHKTEYLQRFFKIAGLFGVKTVLDAGCGNGVGLQVLEKNGFDATGVDLFTKHARQRNPSTRIVDGNVECLPFSDNSFDAAICLGVVHHVDEEKALRELKRVSRDLVCIGVYGSRGFWFEQAENALRNILKRVPYDINDIILKLLNFDTFTRIQRLEHIYVKKAKRFSEKELVKLIGDEHFCITRRIRNWIDCIAISSNATFFRVREAGQ